MAIGARHAPPCRGTHLGTRQSPPGAGGCGNPHASAISNGVLSLLPNLTPLFCTAFSWTKLARAQRQQQSVSCVPTCVKNTQPGCGTALPGRNVPRDAAVATRRRRCREPARLCNLLVGLQAAGEGGGCRTHDERMPAAAGSGVSARTLSLWPNTTPLLSALSSSTKLGMRQLPPGAGGSGMLQSRTRRAGGEKRNARATRRVSIDAPASSLDVFGGGQAPSKLELRRRFDPGRATCAAGVRS